MRCWVIKYMRQDVSFTSTECSNTEIRTLITRECSLQTQANSSTDSISTKPNPLTAFSNS